MPPMPFTPDPDFLAGCIHRVKVSLDANRQGLVTSLRGGVTRSWVPVAGLESVPCRVVPDRDAERDNDHHDGAEVYYKVLLPQSTGLTQNHRLDFVDPVDGTTHLLFVRGQPRDAHFMGVFWVAKATEYVV